MYCSFIAELIVTQHFNPHIMRIQKTPVQKSCYCLNAEQATKFQARLNVGGKGGVDTLLRSLNHRCIYVVYVGDALYRTAPVFSQQPEIYRVIKTTGSGPNGAVLNRPPLPSRVFPSSIDLPFKGQNVKDLTTPLISHVFLATCISSGVTKSQIEGGARYVSCRRRLAPANGRIACHYGHRANCGQLPSEVVCEGRADTRMLGNSVQPDSASILRVRQVLLSIQPRSADALFVKDIYMDRSDVFATESNIVPTGDP